MAKGSKSHKMRQRESQRKIKARRKRQLAEKVAGERSTQPQARRGRPPKLKEAEVVRIFVPLEEIGEMRRDRRDYLHMQGFYEGYYEPESRDFVARRGSIVICGGKLAADDWRVVAR